MPGADGAGLESLRAGNGPFLRGIQMLQKETPPEGGVSLNILLLDYRNHKIAGASFGVLSNRLRIEEFSISFLNVSINDITSSCS